jgi:hypothetical protein
MYGGLVVEARYLYRIFMWNLKLIKKLAGGVRKHTGIVGHRSKTVFWGEISSIGRALVEAP